jgi:Flp pilus assembly protein TadD
MKQSLIAGILAVGLIGSGAWGAESDNAATTPSDSTPASLPPQTEAQFLQQADEAVKAGDAEAAVQLYQSAIVYAPGDPVPYERLAEFYARTGKVELAQRYYGLALDVQPAYAPAVQGLAALPQLAAGDRAATPAKP